MNKPTRAELIEGIRLALGFCVGFRQDNTCWENHGDQVGTLYAVLSPLYDRITMTEEIYRESGGPTMNDQAYKELLQKAKDLVSHETNGIKCGFCNEEIPDHAKYCPVGALIKAIKKAEGL